MLYEAIRVAKSGKRKLDAIDRATQSQSIAGKASCDFKIISILLFKNWSMFVEINKINVIGKKLKPTDFLKLNIE